MDLLGLENRVAIVTGGASGIGKATATLFAEIGIKVVIADFDDELGFQVQTEIRNKGHEIHFFKIDVTDPGKISNLIDFTLENFKSIDILVNCAGVSGLSSYLELIEEEWDWTINTNLKGTHLMCLAVSKVMVKKKIKGKIVNISSINDQIPVAGLAAYAASKGGITSLTRAIALELAPYGINVNALRPGAIDTPMMKEVLELPSLAQAIMRQIPRGRLGRAEDVAKVILFLVSDLAEWVTGAIIPVAGGMHLVGETSYNYYFEKEMQHEDQLPDVPFTRPWKEYNISKFKGEAEK
ncbi:MAG: SDR family NAD(P)-dependent oxidoreductase [Candidatus Hodarchaeales archaeon]